MSPRLFWAQWLVCPTLVAGPFAPGAGEANSDAIAADDPRIVQWASTATVERGPVDLAAPQGARASWGTPAAATGPADATPDDPWQVVSLGDGGSATVRFEPPFADQPGPDFVVFENSFNGAFLELAHVEVSSDGEHFIRFPSTSLTPTDQQVEIAVDPTDIRNLAGKYAAGFGTPFDLAELPAHPALDLERITHVRVIDVVGSLDPLLASHDSEGRLINDPFPTPFHTSGFDLDAVGVISTKPTNYAAWAAAQGLEGAAAGPATILSSKTLPNVLRYASGGLPGVAYGASGTTVSWRWQSDRTDVALRLEASADLADWESVTVSSTGSTTSLLPDVQITESGGDFKDLLVKLPAAHPARYFRLAAELTPP